MKTIAAVMISVLSALTYAHTPLLDSGETIKAHSSVTSDAATISATTVNAPVTQGVNTLIEFETAMLASLEKVKAHIQGETALTAAELAAEHSIIESKRIILGVSVPATELAFETVDMFDAKYGALFTSRSTSDGGFSSRTEAGYELEYMILTIMQAVLDFSYNMQTLETHTDVFKNRKFETSSYFPGAVDAPADENVSYTVQINGAHVKSWGLPAHYETEDARRPTGCYLAPGSVAKVTVPPSLVGIGASILVGAHTWDLSNKPDIKRMDRVSKLYDIDSQTITIANPLGGGIYVNVPFEHDLGILDITLENVVRSPYYANTVANKTTVEQWQDTERSNPAPWADFESDKVMMQVPTSWIYAMDDPSQMMNDWDLAMDGISELFARPLIRSKTIVYSQVDVAIRGDAFYPGYPQSNITYNPDLIYGGDLNYFLTRGLRGATGPNPAIFFHELGHAEAFHKFTGETEAVVNFLWVAVQNKKFGVDLNEAFSTSLFNLNHTIEEAAQSWMIAENFRNGNPMSALGDFQHEFAYQPRGYAKYADIVRLFGWEALETFFYNLNVAHENGVTYSHHVSKVPWDDQSLRLSIASGYDLRPLLHFWGIHPVDAAKLEASVKENNLKSSAAIYDQLMFYKTLVLKDNAGFKGFGLNDFRVSDILNFVNSYDYVPSTYYEGFLNAWWDIYDTEHAESAKAQVQSIIDLYFPNGRPQDAVLSFPGRVEAEDATSENGTRIQDTSDGGGGESVGYIEPGDQLSYLVDVETRGLYKIEFRVASPRSNTVMALSVNGSSVVDINIPNTGGWENWTTITQELFLESGSQTIRFDFSGVSSGLMNINWFEAEYIGSGAIELSNVNWTLSSFLNGEDVDNAIDGDAGSRWTTRQAQRYGQDLVIDLNDTLSFDQIILDSSGSNNDQPRGFSVYVSDIEGRWGSAVATGEGDVSGITTINFDDQTARYIRIVQTGSDSYHWWSIHELQIFSNQYSRTVTD